MTQDVQVEELEARHFVGIRRRVSPEAIGAACGEVLPRMARWLGEKGLQPQGMPATVYHEHDGETFDLQPGFFVATPPDVEAEDVITAIELPGGPHAVTVHVGPYDKLGTTWEAIHTWIGQRGREPTGGPAWEEYLDDPGETDADGLRTRIAVPLKPA